MTAQATNLPSSMKARAVQAHDPAIDAFAITPADADLACVARAIYVGGSGTLVITTPNGSTVTFTNVPVGIFPVSALRVAAASTATGLIGLI